MKNNYNRIFYQKEDKVYQRKSIIYQRKKILNQRKHNRIKGKKLPNRIKKMGRRIRLGNKTKTTKNRIIAVVPKVRAKLYKCQIRMNLSFFIKLQGERILWRGAKIKKVK